MPERCSAEKNFAWQDTPPQSPGPRSAFVVRFGAVAAWWGCGMPIASNLRLQRGTYCAILASCHRVARPYGVIITTLRSLGFLHS